MSAIHQLEEWLTDPRTGKAVTELGEDALLAIRKALVDGKNGDIQKAEDLLEALALRNGRNSGDDIAPGRGYARQGERSTIEVPRPHIRVNLISAISNEGYDS
jgi:hypothetical protein